MSKHELITEIPTPDQVRAALERIVASGVFRSSPQLVSFLSFVVEAVLQGKSDRIKGYTIGIEVLRRDPKFDPQIDPIVRVEATRLRRAIERYYAGPGQTDDVIIDLPRGSYVPTFNFRAGVLDNPEVDDTPNPVARRRFQVAAAGALVTVAAIALWLAIGYRGTGPDITATGSHNAALLRPGNGLPVLFIQPIQVSGVHGPKSISAAALYVRLADAFSHFDLVNVRWQPEAQAAGSQPDSIQAQADYRLFSSIEYDSDGAARLRFELLDNAGTLVWSQVFEHVLANERTVEEDLIASQLSETLVQPFGVIYSDGRNKSIRNQQGDPRYRCVLEAAESFRSFNSEQHTFARSCLERLTSADLNFGIGFTYLAAIDLREYQYGIGRRSDGLPPLDRALRAARRGVEINPESSRAYEMLFVSLFARHDVAAAFSAGEKALKLNRYDRRSVGAFGARLIANGEIDRGLDMLAKAESDGRIIPAFEQFFLFLGNYMRGDMTRAAFHASQLTGDTFQLGLIARALTSAATGDRDEARKAFERLVALNPNWRDDLHGQLGRFFEAQNVLDRLERDLTAAGLTKSLSAPGGG